MTCPSMTCPAGARPLGEVDLVEVSTIASALDRAERDGLLCVTVPPPGPSRRGRLALTIEEAVEDTLARRGAAPPGVGAASLLDATLGDQLYRARLIGASGIAVALPALEGIANLAGALDAEDSAVLRWWIAATRERPVRLLFAERDRRLGVYGSPVTLASLLEATEPAAASLPGAEPTAPAPAPEVAASVAAMELTDAPPVVAPTPTAPPEAAPGVEAATPVAVRAPAAALELDLEGLAPRAAASPALPPTKHIAPPQRHLTRAPDEARTLAAPSPDRRDPSRPDPAAAAEEPATQQLELPLSPVAPGPGPDDPRRSEAPPTATPAADELPHGACAADIPGAEDGPTRPRVEGGEPPAPAPLVADAATRWRAWVEELDATRGPKPLGTVERLFVSTYVPLRDAHDHGVTDGRAKQVADAWAASFEKSYSEAFDALRVRGKRPSMVLDVPDLAQRLARLHGARAIQLVLVDGMRFDLGLRMHGRLQQRLERRAALAERLLLWSALPTTTTTQLDLIGRGPEALKDGRRAPETTLPVARGRAAAAPRRIKAGHRDLLKLDLVAARLAERANLGAGEIDALAMAVGDSLAECLSRLAPRTLAFVFGDHGFRVEDDGAPSEGGASPDEVLVPAFAWVVGEMH